MIRAALAAILSWAFAAGCRPAQKTVLAPVPVDAAVPYQPRTESPDAFDMLVLAGSGMAADVPDVLHRTEFTPGMREETLAAALKRIDTVQKACAQGPKMPDAWSGAGAEDVRAGWRLIGRALSWQIEDAITEQNWPLAAQKAIHLTQFGTALMGGSAEEVSLGLSFAADARRLIAPELRRMEAQTLDNLAAEMNRILDATPDAEESLDRELDASLREIQHVQEAWSSGKLDELIDRYGRTVRPTVQYLKRLEPENVPQFFAGFVAEMHSLQSLCVSESRDPVKTWQKEPEILEAADRPWKRLTDQFYAPMRVILGERAKHTARMKMLILSARIEAQIKRSGAATPALNVFPTSLTTDPYSGEPFAYSVEGTDYRLYSVGENGERDGGMTDESGVEPDLVLEMLPS